MIDLAFIGLDIASRVADVDQPSRLFVTTDRGYAEGFQYLKITAIVLLLGFIAVRTRDLVFYVWTALFCYLLIDDLLRIHETVGGQILGDALVPFLPTAGGNAYKLGQILFSVAVGGLALVAILVSTRASSEAARRTSHSLLTLLFVFAFFSLVLDGAGSWLDFGVRPILEDGGEMVAMSLIAAFVLSVSEEVAARGLPAGVPASDSWSASELSAQRRSSWWRYPRT